MLKYNIHGNTDMGKKRTNNEDAFIAQTLWDKRHLLAVAIDGVGGYEGGEVAAEIAQTTIVDYLQNYSNDEQFDLLIQAVIRANNAIFEERKVRENCEQMSCVLTAALFDLDKGQLHLAHVGDTRLYCCENHVLTKLSHDHSDVGYQEEIGVLSEEAAMNHPQRNVVNRVVGVELHKIDDLFFIDSQTFPLVSNAIYLLCTDGLYDMLTSAEIVSVLEKDISTEEKVQGLIDFANEKGGKDNITVVLIEIDGEIELIQEDEIIENEKDIKINRKYHSLFLSLFCFILGAIVGWFARDIFFSCPHSKQGVIPNEERNLQCTPDTLDIINNDTITIDTITTI
ncbi:MAG: protein phosphatase 2C domain-containing protein [Candidatus Azobacteroides sp.]|nr:protein phosphatase 2C domain-containing protein [Candidatus Azobacteroides sp.]